MGYKGRIQKGMTLLPTMGYKGRIQKGMTLFLPNDVSSKDIC